MFLFYSCWRFFFRNRLLNEIIVSFSAAAADVVVVSRSQCANYRLKFYFVRPVNVCARETIKIDDDSRVCARKHSLALSNQFVLSNVSMNNNNRFKWKRTQTQKIERMRMRIREYELGECVCVRTHGSLLFMRQSQKAAIQFIGIIKSCTYYTAPHSLSTAQSERVNTMP